MGVWKGQNLPFRIDHLIRRRRMLMHWLPASPGWGYLLFSIVYSCLMYCRWIDEKCMGLLLSSVFCSIGLCVCFCAANTLLWLLYCIVYAQVRECHSSRSVLPSQDCCCYLESFGFLHRFGNYLFSFCEKCPWSFGRVCIESVYCLWHYGHCNNIYSPVHERGISFQLFVLSSVSFINALWFSESVFFLRQVFLGLSFFFM